MTRRFKTALKPPFLRHIALVVPEGANANAYPLALPVVRAGIDLEIRSKVLIFVGDNGIGKSTLLEAIAANCGFSLIGGNKNHVPYDTEHAPLHKYLRMSWKPRITEGFFLRAETMFSFIRSIDQIASETGKDIYNAYGGQSLAERSHGEAFLSVFENRFGHCGIYILDEPEAALSPERQLEFLKLIKRLDDTDECQIIIATHSPMLMAYPKAQLVRLTASGLREVEFHTMPHFKIVRDFALDPDSYLAGLLSEG